MLRDSSLVYIISFQYKVGLPKQSERLLKRRNDTAFPNFTRTEAVYMSNKLNPSTASRTVLRRRQTLIF